MRFNFQRNKKVFYTFVAISCLTLFSISFSSWVLGEHVNLDANIDVSVGENIGFTEYVNYDTSKGKKGINIFGLNEEGFINEDGFNLTNGVINCYYILQCNKIREKYEKDVTLFNNFKLITSLSQDSTKVQLINEKYLSKNYLKTYYSTDQSFFDSEIVENNFILLDNKLTATLDNFGSMLQVINYQYIYVKVSFEFYIEYIPNQIFKGVEVFKDPGFILTSSIEF